MVVVPPEFATCQYCGSPTRYADSIEVYRTASYGPALLCSRFPLCDAYVGCHAATGLPKGTVANKYLRLWRTKAHAAFDALWVARGGKKSLFLRANAYRWLSETIGIPLEQCHIGMMTPIQCRMVVDACAQRSDSAPCLPSTAQVPTATIYVDWLNQYGWVMHGQRIPSCHMYVTTLDLEPLHKLAESIGLQRRWLDTKGTVPHYDLTAGKRSLALAAGALPIDDKAGFVTYYRPIRDMWLVAKGHMKAPNEPTAARCR